MDNEDNEDDEDTQDDEDTEDTEDTEEQDCVVYDEDLAYIDPSNTLRKPWLQDANWPALADETIRFVRHALKYCNNGFMALQWLHIGYLALALHSDELAKDWRVNPDELSSFLHAHVSAAWHEIAAYESESEGRGHSKVAYHFWADGDREWGDAFTRGDYESMLFTPAQITERVGRSRVGEPVNGSSEGHRITKHMWDHMLSAAGIHPKSLRHHSPT